MNQFQQALDNVDLTERLAASEQRNINLRESCDVRGKALDASEKQVAGLESAIIAADNILDTYNVKKAPLHDRVYLLGIRLEASEQRVAELEEKLATAGSVSGQLSMNLTEHGFVIRKLQSELDDMSDTPIQEAWRQVESVMRCLTLELTAAAAEDVGRTILKYAHMMSDAVAASEQRVAELQEKLRKLEAIEVQAKNVRRVHEADPVSPGSQGWIAEVDKLCDLLAEGGEG